MIKLRVWTGKGFEDRRADLVLRDWLRRQWYRLPAWLTVPIIEYRRLGCRDCPHANGTAYYRDCAYPDCSTRSAFLIRTWAGSYVELDRAHLALLGWARYLWSRVKSS